MADPKITFELKSDLAPPAAGPPSGVFNVPQADRPDAVGLDANRLWQKRDRPDQKSAWNAVSQGHRQNQADRDAKEARIREWREARKDMFARYTDPPALADPEQRKNEDAVAREARRDERKAAKEAAEPDRRRQQEERIAQRRWNRGIATMYGREIGSELGGSVGGRIGHALGHQAAPMLAEAGAIPYLAAAAAAIAVARQVDTMARQRTDQLAPYSAAISNQLAQNESATVQQNVRAARELGPDLATDAKLNGTLELLLQDIRDNIVANLLPAIDALKVALIPLLAIADGMLWLRAQVVKLTNPFRWLEADAPGGIIDQMMKIEAPPAAGNDVMAKQVNRAMDAAAARAERQAEAARRSWLPWRN